MKSVPRNFRPRRKRKKKSKPMNPKSVIAVTCMGFCGCFILFLLWYYYPYHELQFFVEHTDIDQEHYTNKLVNMAIHPKYEHYIRRHNKNNESLHNVSSINNNYNPFDTNTDTQSILYVTGKSTGQNLENIKHAFLKYLEPICIRKNVLSHDYLKKELPNDCDVLLNAMINISTQHLMNENEINALSQRMEYLMDIVPQNGVYLFIHVPHTAMASMMEHFVGSHFKKTEIVQIDASTNKQLKIDENIKLIYGHLPYGFDKMLISENMNVSDYILSVDELEFIENGNNEHRKLNNLWINKLNFTYYTIMRDPVDLILANYYDGDNEEKYEDFYEFVDDKSHRNIMTKYVSGHDNDKLIHGKDYIKARNNLMSMGWIGLFDDLQNSVDQLTYFWNLKSQNYDKKLDKSEEINKNFDKPFNTKVTVSEHEAIIKRNKWDVMLYELAQVLQMQQQIVVKYQRPPS